MLEEAMNNHKKEWRSAMRIIVLCLFHRNLRVRNNCKIKARDK
jgi:hypothetical protein